MIKNQQAAARKVEHFSLFFVINFLSFFLKIQDSKVKRMENERKMNRRHVEFEFVLGT